MIPKQISGTLEVMGRFRRPPDGVETLERLKRWPGLRRRVMTEAVLIWSGERRGFYRKGGNGYVGRSHPGVGVWSLDAAFDLTRHAGPEKGIEFHSLY